MRTNIRHRLKHSNFKYNTGTSLTKRFIFNLKCVHSLLKIHYSECVTVKLGVTDFVWFFFSKFLFKQFQSIAIAIGITSICGIPLSLVVSLK